MKKTLIPLMLIVLVFTACSGRGQGTKFSEESASNYEKDLNSTTFFKLESPQSGAKIISPVTIKGQAKGSMFFEGTFPVSIEDMDGEIAGSGSAKALTNWMTEEFVPFESTITFTTGTTIVGNIVLENDNPSGLPENSQSAKFPVSFK